MKKRKIKIIVLGIFLIFLGIYWSIPDGKLRIIFCDVGQGDGAIVIRGNWQMVIDTGADNGRMERCLDRYLPFWDKTLEGVMISHWDKDHSDGLKNIIKSYMIDRMYESTMSGEQIEQNVNTEVLKAGDIIRYGKIDFEILHPVEGGSVGNESSLVAVLNYMGRKFMFTGDVDMEGEGEMMSWWKGRVEGLKVSHHGSDTGNSEAWINRLEQVVAVLSVGKNNYGHPREIILERFKKMGVKVLRTDMGGDVILGWN